MEKKKILIVDDTEDIYVYLSVVLTRAGYSTIYASTGQQAVNLCSDDASIDLVLMDIQMPGMNGVEAFERIRSNRKDLPVIAQTAFALVGDEEKYINSGFDGYISKPINRHDLLTLVESVLTPNLNVS